MKKYRNFARVAEGLDVSRLQAQVAEHQHLFVDLSRGQLKKGDVGYSHRHGQIIIVRYPKIPQDADSNPDSRKQLLDDLFSVNHEPWYVLTELRPFLYRLMMAVEGTHIGGIGVIKLPAGKKIDRHYDTGLATDFYNRFHLVLSGPAECWFTCGKGKDEERVAMRDGEVWWFNSKKLHSVFNNDSVDRISVSIDIGTM
jgi:Aspartyl/Asparaginyl beta-hydroxylase